MSLLEGHLLCTGYVPAVYLTGPGLVLPAVGKMYRATVDGASAHCAQREVLQISMFASTCSVFRTNTAKFDQSGCDVHKVPSGGGVDALNQTHRAQKKALSAPLMCVSANHSFMSWSTAKFEVVRRGCMDAQGDCLYSRVTVALIVSSRSLETVFPFWWTKVSFIQLFRG